MPEFRNTLKPKNLDRVVRNEIREELKLGETSMVSRSGGLPPGKFCMTTPLRSFGKRPILENLPGGGGNYHICRYGVCHFLGCLFSSGK